MSEVAIVHREKIGETPVEFSEHSVSVITEMIDESFRLLGIRAETLQSKSVLIKPNLVRPDPQRNPSISTDPRVILALCRYLIDCGANKITVGENPGYGLPAKAAFRLAQIVHPLKRMGIGLSFFDEEEIVCVPNPRGVLLKRVYQAKSVIDHEILINVPKMKTHKHTLVSLGLKNLQGILLDPQRRLFHRNDIEQKIIDTYLSAVPWLTLIDGIWPMEGQAPFCGLPIRDFNTIVAGQDTVAVDMITSEIMGFSHEEIATLRIARWMNLPGSQRSDINVLGQNPNDVKRQFIRPVLSSTGVFENILVIEGGACTGCLSALRHSLDKMACAGGLEKLGDATIYVGRPMPNVKTVRDWRGTLYLFGNCAVDLVFSHPEKRLAPVFIPGCAPHVLDFYRTVIGE